MASILEVGPTKHRVRHSLRLPGQTTHRTRCTRARQAAAVPALIERDFELYPVEDSKAKDAARKTHQNHMDLAQAQGMVDANLARDARLPLPKRQRSRRIPTPQEAGNLLQVSRGYLDPMCRRVPTGPPRRGGRRRQLPGLR